jgi:hypothetical protein
VHASQTLYGTGNCSKKILAENVLKVEHDTATW